jgi:cell division protein ZapA (FtsZ GTPase activity inhibitor)
MSKVTKTLEIKLLDRDLRVACPDEERGELLDAVAFWTNACVKFAMPEKLPALSASR